MPKLSNSTRIWYAAFTGVQEIAPAKTDGDSPATVSLSANSSEGIWTEEKIADANFALREAILSQIRQGIETVKPELRKLFGSLELKGDNWIFKQKLLDYRQGKTQMDELDFTELQAALQELSQMKKKATEAEKETEKQFASKLNRATLLLEPWSQKMESARGLDSNGTSGKGELLFSKEDRRKEIWTPLVRSRYWPETLIADGFSETQSLINGTLKLYQDAIDEKRKAGELKSGFRVLTESSIDVVLAGAGVVAAGFGLDSAIKENAIVNAGKASEQISSRIKMGREIADSTKELVGELIDSKGDVTAVTKAIVLALAKIGTSICGSLMDDVDVGAEEKLSTIASDANKIWENSKNKALISVGDSLTFVTLLDPLYARLSTNPKPEVKKAGDAVAIEIEKMAEKIKNQVGVDLSGYIAESCKTLRSLEDGISIEDFAEKIKKALNKIKISNVADLKKNIFDAGTIDQKLKEEQDEQIKAIKKELEKETNEGEETGNNRKSLSDSDSIDKLIAEIKRTEKYWKTLTGFLGLGMTALSQVVPVLSAANCIAEFIEQCRMAHKARKALCEWQDSRTDLRAAQNALSSAAQNFVNNQSEQLSHAIVKATFKLIQMIAELAAIGFAPLKIGAAGAQIGDAASDLAFEVANKVQLAQAWTATKKALLNPKNRKVNLYAHFKNPTMAKYAVAWAATNRDVLAIEAMRACGMSKDVLLSAGGDANKVFEYLEAKFSNDREVYVDLVLNADWVPQNLKLTVEYWLRLKTAMLAQPSVSARNIPADSNVINFLSIAAKTLESEIEINGKKEKITTLSALGNPIIIKDGKEKLIIGKLETIEDVYSQLRKAITDCSIKPGKCSNESAMSGWNNALINLSQQVNGELQKIKTVKGAILNETENTNANKAKEDANKKKEKSFVLAKTKTDNEKAKKWSEINEKLETSKASKDAAKIEKDSNETSLKNKKTNLDAAKIELTQAKDKLKNARKVVAGKGKDASQDELKAIKDVENLVREKEKALSDADKNYKEAETTFQEAEKAYQKEEDKYDLLVIQEKVAYEDYDADEKTLQKTTGTKSEHHHHKHHKHEKDTGKQKGAGAKAATPTK